MEHHSSPPFASHAPRTTGDSYSESYGGNAARLLGHILSTSPQDQRELRSLLQQSYSLPQSSSVTPNAGGLRSPMIQHHMTNETSSSLMYLSTAASNSPIAMSISTAPSSSPIPMSISTSPSSSPIPMSISTAAGNSPTSLISSSTVSPSALRPLGSASVGGENNVQMIASKVNVQLNLLETYIILFIRYPLAAPGGNNINNATYPNHQRGTSVVSRAMAYCQIPISKTMPYGEVMYQNLFESYLWRYFPYDFQYGASNLFNIRSGNGINRNSELFLRTVIDFWLEGNNVFPTTSNALQQLYNSSYDGSNQELQPGLDASYDMARINSKRVNTSKQHHSRHPLYFLQNNVGYTPPPPQIQHCLEVLVNHFICDPAIKSLCCDEGITFTSRVDDAGTMAWPLPAAHTIL